MEALIEDSGGSLPTANPARTSHASGRASPLRIWLVDDDNEFRKTLAEVLARQHGIQCARDFSSPDALLSVLASKTGPEVILLDIEMRGRSGLDAIGPIKALSRETQVVMLTSFYDDRGHTRALAEGASDFLLKSDRLEEIVDRIRNPRRRVNARRRIAKPACSGHQHLSRAAGSSRASHRMTSGSPRPAGNPPSLLRKSVSLLHRLLMG